MKKIGKKKDEKARIDEIDAETAATLDKKWDKAAGRYRSAAGQYGQIGMEKEKNSCECKACACELNLLFEGKTDNPTLVRKLSEAAQDFQALGDEKIELILGTKTKKTYPSPNLVTELNGVALFLQGRMAGEGPEARKFYEEAARKLLSLGESETFAISQLSSVIGRQTTPQGLAFEANAESQRLAAMMVADKNPEEAIGALSKAISSFEQAGLRSQADSMRKLQKRIQTTRTCYMCGRESTGEGFHFEYYRSDAGDYFKNVLAKKGQDPNMISEDGDSVVLCRVCGSTIHNEADAIAKEYYDRIMEYVKDMERKLWTSISRLEQAVSDLNSNVSAIRSAVSR